MQYSETVKLIQKMMCGSSFVYGNFFHALHEKPFIPLPFVLFRRLHCKLLGQSTHKRQRDSLIWYSNSLSQ